MNFHFNILDSCQSKTTYFLLLTGSLIPALKQLGSQLLWRVIRYRVLSVVASGMCDIPMCLSINQLDHVLCSAPLVLIGHRLCAFERGDITLHSSPGAQWKRICTAPVPPMTNAALWQDKIFPYYQQDRNPQTDQNSISWSDKACIKSVRAGWDLCYYLLIFSSVPPFFK